MPEGWYLTAEGRAALAPERRRLLQLQVLNSSSIAHTPPSLTPPSAKKSCPPLRPDTLAFPPTVGSDMPNAAEDAEDKDAGGALASAQGHGASNAVTESTLAAVRVPTPPPSTEIDAASSPSTFLDSSSEVDQVDPVLTVTEVIESDDSSEETLRLMVEMARGNDACNRDDRPKRSHMQQQHRDQPRRRRRRGCQHPPSHVQPTMQQQVIDCDESGPPDESESGPPDEEFQLMLEMAIHNSNPNCSAGSSSLQS